MVLWFIEPDVVANSSVRPNFFVWWWKWLEIILGRGLFCICSNAIEGDLLITTSSSSLKRKYYSLWLSLSAINFIYSLITIRQGYNFDMSATIWHEIVSWFSRICTTWSLICFCFDFHICSAEQFYDRNKQERGKT